MNTSRGGYSPKWTEKETAYLREHYATASARDVAAVLGRTETALHVRAHILGLKSLHRTGVNSAVEDYFRVIDAPMKAYLLGLLLADGSVSKVGQVKLELHEKDKQLVELARDEIAPGARIGFYRTRTTPMARFMISSPSITADLAYHGVVNAKSLITRWPDSVPAEHEGSFVCGYFDGDGSMSTQRERGRPEYPRWSVVSGNPAFLREMQARIFARTGAKTLGPYQDKRHNAAWSIVSIGAPAQVLDAWMHRDVPGLARKRVSAVMAARAS